MSNEHSYTPGQKVDLEILRQTPLGFVALINGEHEGLLYHSELFEQLKVGLKTPGYINRLRPDGSIDLLLHAFGNLGAEELGERILQVLLIHDGFLPVNDKSPAEQIYELFGASKKKYKIALGGLYKSRKITISPDGIRINK